MTHVLKICLVLVFFLYNLQLLQAFPSSHRSMNSGRLYGKPVTVTFEPSNIVVECEQGDLIDTVAKKSKIKIPFGCKSGRCNSCEVRLNGRASAKVCQGAKIPAGPTKKLAIKVINTRPLKY